MANRVNRMALERSESPAGPTTLHDIPDKLLKLILLYLTSPHWLVRAAATCKRWRRIIVDANFLSEIGSIPHSSSLVAGHYHNHTAPVDGRCLIFVPSSSALDVSSRHFSLDFLPPGGSRSWEIVDSRHTLLLLAKKKTGWRRHTLPSVLIRVSFHGYLPSVLVLCLVLLQDGAIADVLVFVYVEVSNYICIYHNVLME